MRKTNIGFPYPVLCSDSNDYTESYFILNADKDVFTEKGKIKFELSYALKSDGLQNMIKDKKAKTVLFLESIESSYRKIIDFESSEKISVEIDVSFLANTLRVKALIVSCTEMHNFSFTEHNKDLFGSFEFTIHKGDILAISNLFEIPLKGIDPLENKPSIFSIRPEDSDTTIRIDLLEDNDKINIWLRRDLHILYQDLREEPAIRMLLTSYFILPALIEALSFIKYEGPNGDNEDIISRGWYQSLNDRLLKLGIKLEEEFSITSVANRILNDIIQEGMNSLKHIKDNILTGNA